MRKSKSLFHKFLFTYIFISLIGLCITFASFSYISRLVIDGITRDNLKQSFSEITELYEAFAENEINIMEFTRSLQLLGRTHNVRLNIELSDSESTTRTAYFSNYKENYLSELMTKENFDEILSQGQKIETIYLPEIKQNIMLLTSPLMLNDEQIGVIYAHSSISIFDSHISKNYYLYITLFLLSSTYSFIAIYIITRKLTKPFIQMTKVTESIAEGNFDEKVDYDGDDEISTLAYAINNMSEKLKKSNKAQKDFIANISHELRTPLTTIQANTQGIIDGVIEDNEINTYMQVNLDETKRLTELVNELIQLSAKDSGNSTLVKTPTDISNIASKSIKQMKMKAEERNIKITSDIERNIVSEVDKNKIKQLFINLLDNAIKYNKEDGTINLVCKKEDENVYISVEDTGIGLSEEQIERVFERFEKFNNSQGLGIGLNICKEIVESHGGTISVESTKDIGTKFEVRIPIVVTK